MAAAVHKVAQAGFGSGTNELYNRARPTYQPQPLANIRQAVKAEAPLKVVEIGAGTGICTRALLDHPDWASDIGELKAIEPSAGMREFFSKSTNDARVRVDDGTFDNTGVEYGWADLIIIAQAFHWCLDYDRACAEFARVLKPNGMVAFIWNIEDRTKARWVAEVRDHIRRHDPGTPNFQLGLWRQTFDTPSYKNSFQPPIENEQSYSIPTTIEGVAQRVISKSCMVTLPEDLKSQVVADVKDVVNRGQDKVWIDEAAGVFEFPYKTCWVIAQKK